MKALHFCFLSLSVFLACGNQNADSAPSAGPSSSQDTLYLSVTDTIGVLMGDSIREFGSLADVQFDGNGNILALDAIKGRITIFDSSLEFTRFVGRHGSGPGEFQYPNCFGQLTDGRLIVPDFSGSTATFFDSLYNYESQLAGFPLVPPMYPCPGPDGSYYAGCLSIDMEIEGDLPTGDSFLGLYTSGKTPDTILVSFPLSITIDNQGDVNVDNVDVVWDSDSRGNLFWAVRDGESYSIQGLTPLGEVIFTVEKSWEPIEKTEEELQEEVFSEGLSRSDEGESTVRRDDITQTYPYHLAIAGLYVDGDDNLWVEQGYTDTPTFEIYSSRGEFLRTAVIPDLAGLNQLQYCVNGGMLAYDFGPTDYPKIYILSRDAD